MKLTEDEIFEKYAERRLHFTRNNLLPYEFEYTSNACGWNLMKRKNEFRKFRRKK